MRVRVALASLILLFLVHQAMATDVPAKIVLTIDVSGSMGGEKIVKAKTGATTFLDVLTQYDAGKNDEVSLVTFSTDVQVLSNLNRDFDHLKSLISTLSASGSTSMWDAVYDSVDILKNDPSQAKAVLLLTDGQDNDSEHTKNESIQHAKDHKVRVFVIGVGADVNDDDLRELAEETGGSYWHIEVANLVDIYEMIALKMSIIFPPDAEIVYYPEHPKVGEVVTFDASQSSSPKGIITYNWYFSDDKSTAQGVKVQHVFTKPGNHTVVLTVYDSDYIPDTEIVTVNVSGENEPINQYTLDLKIYNVENKPMPSSGGYVLVGIYQNGNVVDTKQLQYSGGERYLETQFSLDEGSYKIKVYQTPNVGLKYTEYWGEKDVTLLSDKTVTFTRNTLVIQDVRVNGESIYNNPEITENIQIDIVVKNYGSSTVNAKALVIIDDQKNNLQPDFKEQSNTKTVAPGSTETFTFTTTLSEGTYYLATVVYGNYSDEGGWRATDQNDWISIGLKKSVFRYRIWHSLR